MLPPRKFCTYCGGRLQRVVPPGDHFERDVCERCGQVHYRNPKVVVGCIPLWRGRLLMCRRAIEPRKGYWTFPSGYLELDETCVEGAAREALEETGVAVDIGSLLALIDVPQIGQVHVVYRARAHSGDGHATEETEETVLMSEAEIPWKRIAFPSIHRALEMFFADQADGHEAVHTLNLRGSSLR
ncbi:MAG TPA: NUDIX hydrolase [Nevskiaceae bacterium]